MSNIIGFKPPKEGTTDRTANNRDGRDKITTGRKSLVRVWFENRSFECTYYNDEFDLKVGDIVFVEGKCEGERGRVTDVSYSFKIKLSDYKRVIAVADTEVCGELSMLKEHLVSFDRDVMPYSKVYSWFAPPLDMQDMVESDDDTAFLLENMKGFKVSSLIADRGADYYSRNRVVYISIDETSGNAIVLGTRPYTVEFSYQNGEIKNLRCDCYCVGACKHVVATMLQLRDILRELEDTHSDELSDSTYFSAIYKPTFFTHAIATKSNRKLTLQG